jgi:hypothetical protein
MSLLYSDLPVYVGLPNTTGIVEDDAYVPATQVNVNYNTNSAPRRNLGVKIASVGIGTDVGAAPDQFGFGAALAATISFTCILQEEFQVGFEFFADEANDAYVPIKIGDNFFQKCYATDIAISIAPDAPVTLQANFICLDPAIGSLIAPPYMNKKIEGDSTPYTGDGFPINADQLIYGQFCTVSNMQKVVGNVQSQINFKRTYQRTPIYTLGSVNASTALLDGIEEEMSITSTGLNNLIGWSGDMLTVPVTVGLSAQDGSNLDYVTQVSMAVGARVLTEGYNVAGGDTVAATATLKQVTL